MLTARPSKFRGGGGILRDVDGTITKLEFTDVYPFAAKDGKRKKSDFHALYCVLEILADGAEKPNIQPLFVGDADVLVPNDEATGVTGDGELSKRSDFYVFLNSAVEAGFPEEDLPEDEAEFGALVNRRFRFNWQVDEYATKNLGKRKVKGSDGKTKEYNREQLIVTNYYGEAEATPAPKSGKATAPATRKPAAAKKQQEVDVPALAAEKVTEILSNSDGPMPVAKVLMKLLNAIEDEAQRKAVRTFVQTNPAELEGIEYDAKTKALAIA